MSDLADVAHLQMGRELTLTLEEVDLVALVRQVVSEEQTQAGMALIDVEAPTAVWVRGDRQRLGRVLQNVIGNAVKYSPFGRPIQVVVLEQAAHREAIFQQSVDSEKTRGDALSKRFEEALKQAREEPVTKPMRDFDLD